MFAAPAARRVSHTEVASTSCPAGLKGAAFDCIEQLSETQWEGVRCCPSTRAACPVLSLSNHQDERWCWFGRFETRSVAPRRRRAFDLGSPAEAPRSAAGHRGKANCLRPWMAELFAGRWPASTAGYRAGDARSARMPGSPFLWLLSFGEAKESDSLAVGE